MYNVRKVTEDLYWVGANDRRLHLFENIHPIPQGVSYNAYVLLDDKTVLFDTVDWACGRQFFDNVSHVLGDRDLDYIVVNHVEPDHAATLGEILLRYPNAKIICTAKAKTFLEQFGFDIDGKVETVKGGDTKSFGKHNVAFVLAPMVHWPEVMMTFDTTDGVLFSADAFGSFKSLDGKLFADEVDYDRDWLDEARRYYTNIVGKYGKNVQAVLKKAAGLDIKIICPLHGLVWRKDIGYFIDKYQHWAGYEAEEQGVLIAYASMYGNTEEVADTLANELAKRGVTNLAVYDVSKTDKSYIISDAFKYSHIVFASVTYNLNIYPTMHDLINDMQGLAVQNKTCAIIENGTWAIKAGSLIEDELAKMKDMRLLTDKVTVKSAPNVDSHAALEALADAIAKDIHA